MALSYDPDEGHNKVDLYASRFAVVLTSSVAVSLYKTTFN